MLRSDDDPEPAASNGTNEAPKKKPYVAPVIPMGLPHVVQFVTGSVLDQSPKFQIVADRMSRYSDANGWLSMAQEFLCEITGVGSKNTIIKYQKAMENMGILQIEDEQGGNERRSKRYRLLGEQYQWKPLQVEEPGTDFRAELRQARHHIRDLEADNADLRARLDLLTNGSANGHFEAIRHSGSQSEVTDGSGPETAETPSGSYETSSSDEAAGDATAIRHSGVTDGPTEGQEYLARRARVEELVMKHRDYYQQSFNRRGVLGAIEYFSRSAEHEEDLIRQVGILDAGGEPQETGAVPPPEAGDPPQPPVEPDRYAVGECPDCGRPFGTYGGATHCTECTQRRRRESEA